MITSNSNERIRSVIHLISDTKTRKEKGLFVAEGEKMFLEAPTELIKEVYVSERHAENCTGEIREKLEKTGYETVSAGVFDRMSDTKTPQGILCVLRQRTADPLKVIDEHKGRIGILITEGIQDPGNFGTMIRTAEGAGFDLIIADRKTVDLYNPKVIRATMGSIYRMDIAYTNDLKETVRALRQRNITVYAAHLKGEGYYNEEKYGDRNAFLIGNEGNGLSDEISALADKLIKIPMQGKVESLNAAVAAALLMYETGRRI
ncbi:MAG: RNA methyltransferase [Lachnospiraceae bacterium]|nr:RNA methyltransferase [Lachnospiraceae bacterium]